MSWWGWLIIGFGLAAAELLGVEAAYYLIFVGFAAIFMGLLGLAGLTLPIWVQWLLFSVVAITAMVLFRAKLYNRLRGNVGSPIRTLVGELVEVPADVAPGGRCRVRLRGSTWSAQNVGGTPLNAGQQAHITATDGGLLKIEALAGA